MDTVLGLPAHPLVVHAVVVLLPLTAVVTALVSSRPAWRQRLGWPVVAANAVVLLFAVAGRQSGSALQQRLPGVNIADHAEWGETLPFFAAALLLTSLLAAGIRHRNRLGPLVPLLTVLAAAGAVYWTLRTGHSGAVAVWGSTVQ